jgi:methylphosphotriester-DNA--protein-cysteine methyltransferase
MPVLYTALPPSPALHALVECFWSVEGRADTGGVVHNRVLPDGCMDVIFNLGDAPLSGGASSSLSSYVVGAMRGAVVVGHTGQVDLLGVRFRPGGAVPFLDAPAQQLTDGVADLSEFWRDVAALADALASMPCHSGLAAAPSAAVEAGSPASAGYVARERLRARARVLERALLARSAPAPQVDPLVAEAVRMIRQSQGSAQVRDVERALATTERTLQRRFAAAVGLTPKEAARVARFMAATSLLRRQPRPSLARAALEAGYADQSHLTREFVRLAGITPAAWLRENGDGFVQDDDIATA